MVDYRDPDLILEEIRDLENVIISNKELLKKYPTDLALKLSLDQAEFRKNNLISELQESLQHSRCHTLKYIIDTSVNKINLDIFVNSLESIKKLVDKTFEVMTKKTEQKFDLYFNTVFGSSFGILLSTSYDDKLFGSYYENAFGSVFEMLNAITVEGEDKIHSIIQEKLKGNRKLIRKYSNFFESVSNSLSAVRLEWREPNNNTHKVKIEFDKAKKLYSLFKEHEKHEEEVIELLGFIKGLSLINYTIEFQKSTQQKKEVIKARFDKNMSEAVKTCLDVLSKAKFKVSIELNEITEEEKKKWELLEIQKL